MTEETIDWENNGIKDMLHAAMYANALCTCADETSPCALHALEAFKVWLYASGVTTRDISIDSHLVTHFRGSEPEGRESLPRSMAKAFYCGRIPWSLTLYPQARRLSIAYLQTSGGSLGASWFDLRNRAHDWDVTHSCNLNYIQFAMAMLMPRPSLPNDPKASELVPTFE